MSQPELLTRLREARPVAPPELRERIRLVAAQAPPPRRTITWRRALVVVVPVALAVGAAIAFLPRSERPAADTPPAAESQPFENAGAAPTLSPVAPTATDAAKAGATRLTPTAPPPDTGRAQRYSATLELRVPSASAVSGTTTRALRIVDDLGGYPTRVDVDARQEAGSAYLRLRVPRARVQEAVRRLGALGTIVAADVSIQDLQVGVDAAGQQIARLQERLATLRAQPQTEEVQRQVAALTAQIERKQRARAATLASAQLALVELRIATPPEAVDESDGNGPLHGLGVIFRWTGIVAVYAVAIAVPIAALVALGWLLARRVGRRREERLLSET
jgi:hypothetical protein